MPLINALDLTGDTVVEYGLCIVGAGAAGITQGRGDLLPRNVPI